jgi:hypothetical protein
MTAQKGFWEEIGISIDDLLANQTETESVQNLLTKLQSLSAEALPNVKDLFAVPGDSLIDVLWALRTKSSPDFFDLYALVTFAERSIDPEIIYKVAAGKFEDDFNRRVETKTIEPAIIMIALLRYNPESIRKIFYDHEIQKSSSKRYISVRQLDAPIEMVNVEAKTIERLLEEHELKKAPRNRRPVKLWWFDKSDSVLTIVFRREKAESTRIKLVSRNMFEKTGDEKTFKIMNNGNSIDIYSKREPIRTKQFAEYIVGQLTGKTVTYDASNGFRDPLCIEKFITRLCKNCIPNTKLLNIRVKNTPLANSPTIELDCAECLVPALDELNETHGLSLLQAPQNLISLIIKHNDHQYRLKSQIKDGKITLVFDNRNLRGNDKEQMNRFLDEQLGG